MIVVNPKVVAMLEDIVAYAHRKQCEFIGEEVTPLDIKARLGDLVVLGAAIGNCIQGMDRVRQIGSNYLWEDASFIQMDEQFVKAFDELLAIRLDIIEE